MQWVERLLIEKADTHSSGKNIDLNRTVFTMLIHVYPFLNYLYCASICGRVRRNYRGKRHQ